MWAIALAHEVTREGPLCDNCVTIAGRLREMGREAGTPARKSELHQLVLDACRRVGELGGPQGYFRREPLVLLVAELAEAVQPHMDEFLLDHVLVPHPEVRGRVLGAATRITSDRATTALEMMLARYKGIPLERIELGVRELLVRARQHPARYDRFSALLRDEAGTAMQKMMLPYVIEHPIPYREWIIRSWAFGADPELRLLARRALARIGGAKMRDDLRRMVQMDRDPETRYHASRSLEKLGDSAGKQGLDELAREKGSWARLAGQALESAKKDGRGR